LFFFWFEILEDEISHIIQSIEGPRGAVAFGIPKL